MGEALLRSHVQALRRRLEAVPPQSARVQRLDLEDNVVEFKVVPEGDPLVDRGKRLSFLVYETEAYPASGGAVMSEDEQDEALVETINARLGDEGTTVAEALRLACCELGVDDPALLACFVADGDEASPAAASSSSAPCAIDAEAGIAFEGEDEDAEGGAGYAMFIGAIADREHRPGWKKLKWQEVEEQRIARRREQQKRAEAEPGHKRRKGCGVGEMTMEEQKAADEQMWSSQEAFTILSNELYQLQTEADPSLETDAIDYDVHRWVVRLRGCSGRLGADLSDLQGSFGYDYIELHLSFKEDLHPFYPPMAAVVRPRLYGRHDVVAALACHPRLQLRGWSPFQTTKDLLLSIRRFLESIARVDKENEQNDITRFPGGAFSPLEQQLAQLGSLCEIVPLDLKLDQASNPYADDPWAQDEVLTQTSLGAMLIRRKEREQAVGSKQPKGPSFWAAGTGYGHDLGPRVAGGGSSWDPQAMKAAQVAQDEELKQLVRAIRERLAIEGSRMGTGSQDAATVLADLLSKSCLPPFLVRELSTSYMSMGDRLSFFEEVYKLVEELLKAAPSQAGLLLELARPHLRGAQCSAQTFLQSLGQCLGSTEVSDDVAFAKLAVRVAEEVERICGAAPPPAREAPAVGSASSSSAAAPPPAPSSRAEAASEAEYISCMGAYRLDQTDFESHAFLSAAQAETTTPQARTLRLAKELAGLASLLPLSGSSSVFVRVDASRQQLWRILVTGPDDTPYSGGCFVFDAYFPPQYPAAPPRVKLLTTGNGSVTFNPNLYESGKVCLSLLGTWKGDKAESWDATHSRMLQVLVSIQSLIFVPEPYFNEPGYEREIGTKQGEMRSREYNIQVRDNCVRWAMIDLLRNPPAEFTEVIRAHFRLRAPKVLETVHGWLAEASKGGNPGPRSALIHGLTTELAKIGGKTQECVPPG